VNSLQVVSSSVIGRSWPILLEKLLSFLERYTMLPDKVHTWIYENIFYIPNGGISFFLYLREYFTMLLGIMFPFS
jgi:hypothetical protein